MSKFPESGLVGATPADRLVSYFTSETEPVTETGTFEYARQ